MTEHRKAERRMRPGRLIALIASAAMMTMFLGLLLTLGRTYLQAPQA